MLGPGLLNDRDHDRQQGEGKEDQRLLDISEKQINCASPEQQGEHRLAQHFEHDAQWRPAIWLRQFVWTLGGQPHLGLGFAEAGQAHGGAVVSFHGWLSSR